MACYPNTMKPYLDLMRQCLEHGDHRTEERTGTGTRSVFGGMLEFDVSYRFPLLQEKETRYKVAFLEMLWFLRGEPHTKFLNDHGCKLWDAWSLRQVSENGKSFHLLGPIYGVQWRAWKSAGRLGSIDQIRQVIRSIQANPQGRRHMVSAWNPADLEYMALPPCHHAHQLFVSSDGHLDMVVHQRSWDLGLGAPFNIAQYALLLHLYARAAGYKPRMLKFSYGDAHVYDNHVEGLTEMLNRHIEPDNARLVFHTDNTDIDGYTPGDFSIEGYNFLPFIKLPVAV